MKELFNDRIIKRHLVSLFTIFTIAFCLIIVLSILSRYQEFKSINNYKDTIIKGILYFLLVLNCIFIFKIFLYINKKLNRINSNVTQAMNGNYSLNEELVPEYKEGILYSIEYQQKMLITRLIINNNQIAVEKKKQHTLVTEITHQLKTPIAAVKLFHSLLENDGIPVEEKNNILIKMRDEINRIEWFTKSLTDISKLETGLIQLKLQKNNINDTIVQAVNAIYIIAKEKNININMEGTIKEDFIHDVKWTKEAIINVLDNAIKYTDMGGVIGIELVETSMSKKIRIADTGKGIEEKVLPYIFNRFYKGDKTGTDEGIGIGLYLAKEIMRNQNGTIKVYSKINKGTTIELIFYTL